MEELKTHETLNKSHKSTWFTSHSFSKTLLEAVEKQKLKYLFVVSVKYMYSHGYCKYIYKEKDYDSIELTFDLHINICTLNNVTETAQKLVKIQGKKLENCDHLQPLTYTNTVLWQTQTFNLNKNWNSSYHILILMYFHDVCEQRRCFTKLTSDQRGDGGRDKYSQHQWPMATSIQPINTCKQRTQSIHQ